MTNHVPLVAGMWIGLSIAAPVGPMAFICIQRTLSSGMGVGVSTGLGAATVSVVYSAAILFGMSQTAPWIASGGRILSVLGGLFLLFSAARLFLRHSVTSPSTVPTPPSPLAAYASAIAFNTANPMSLVLVVALVPSLTGQNGPRGGDAIAVLAGLFVAAAGWWSCLSGGVALLRNRLSPALLGQVNRIAGILLTAYGAVTLARSVHWYPN